MKSNVYWLLGGLAALPFMVSTQSLWIDEAQTANYAFARSLTEFVSMLSSDTQSEAMMPLSMWISWVFAQVFGTSELALRIPNLLYLAFGISCVWRVGCDVSAPFIALLFAAHPFLWQYADEARPYALQLGSGSALVASTYYLLARRGQSIRVCWVFAGTGWLLSATSLLAVFPWVCAAGFVATNWWKKRWPIHLQHLVWMGITVACFLPLGIFYLHGLQKGAAGSKIWDVGLANLAFSAYEMLGFQGLGPGRSALREAARLPGGLGSAIFPHLLAMAAMGVTLLAGAALGSVPKRQSMSRSLFFFLLSILISTPLLLQALAISAGFPFWGRHLAPLLPCVVILMTLWISSSRQPKVVPIILTAIGLFWLASSLHLRFSPRFAKDDYRSAAAVANEASFDNKVVWWAADPGAANYYKVFPWAGTLEQPGLHATSLAIRNLPISPASVYLVIGGTQDFLSGLPKPDVVILSKVDIYDHSGALRTWMSDNNFVVKKTIPAFTVWEKKKQ